MKYIHAYADLLTFHNALTVIEQKLFIMFYIANLHLNCNNLCKEYYACSIY
jgi:hypothetical protein